MKKITFLLLALSLIFSACQKDDPAPEVITSSNLNFNVTFDQDFENTIYPSLILGLSSYEMQQEDKFNFLKIEGTVPTDYADLKIEISETPVNSKTTLHQRISGKGTEFEIYPQVNWKFDELKKIDQPGNVTIPFTCYVDGEEIDSKSLRLSYRSVNECIFGMEKDGELINMGWMFGAYVNENHPLIDPFLQSCLNNDIVPAFTGYQDTTTTSVFNQVFAIWYQLQLQKVKYSNITNTGNNSNSIYSQHVRFFDQVYNNTQANCVDGSVFLCSVLQKIGIETFLVLVPGHMYMGFYQNDIETKVGLLETTMIGSINLDDYSTEYDKLEASLTSFIQALLIREADFNNSAGKFQDLDNFQYSIYKISELRKAVSPIAR